MIELTHMIDFHQKGKLKFELAEMKRADFHGEKNNNSKLYKNEYYSGMFNSSSSSQLMTG